MITFKKIRWRNFLSTGNVFTEIDLTKNKTNLIVGKNGAGKSTILDALTFSLFGKPFRGKADAIGHGRIVDLKTCADLNKFKWNAKDFKYMCQVYIYCNLFGIDYKDFYFLVIDKNTNDIGVFDISEDFYNLGESLVEQAVEIYTDKIERGMNELHNYIVRDTL